MTHVPHVARKHVPRILRCSPQSPFGLHGRRGTAGAPKGRTRKQPRLNPSVALSKCTPWVLNCEHAGFGFVDTTLAKLW